MAFRKSLLIFFIVFIQSILAVSGGLFILYFSTRSVIPQNTNIWDISIGGLTKSEAIARLKENVGKAMQNKSITLKVDSDKRYIITYKDINTAFDYPATADCAINNSGKDFLSHLLIGHLLSKPREIYPVASFDEKKLKEKLVEVAAHVDKAPINADINIRDGKVVKQPENNGFRLDIDKTLLQIKKLALSNFEGSKDFEISYGSQIKVIYPEFTMKKYDYVDQVISSYSTPITDKANETSVKNAALALNKAFVFADDATGVRGNIFSFNHYIALANMLTYEKNEGYNQVASTLYAAILSSGIDKQYINRTKNDSITDYIEPGLDAKVLGNSIDLTFKNTMKHPLVIFTEVKDGKLTVTLAGTEEDAKAKYSIKSEIEQVFTPSVTTIENKNLKQGEQKVISPGKEGVKVKTYVLNERHGKLPEKKLISIDKYEPIDATIQIGPNTEWSGLPGK